MFNINNLPYPEIIRNLYQKYYFNVRREGEEYSSHWKKYSSLCDVRIDSQGDIRATGCGFGDIYYQKPWHRVANALSVVSHIRKMQDTRDIRKLMRESSDLLRKFSAYMSYDVFRQLCALSLIKRYLSFKAEDSLKALIIGDGYGFLSGMVHTLYPRSRITLVDIGSTLLFQALSLQSVFPDCVHGLMPFEKDPEADFVYCKAEEIASANGYVFDLIINISSMQEMTMEMINVYFSFIRKTAQVNNIFYCCNRESKVLPGGEKIEYMKYPWKNDDKIMLDEIPAFYRHYYSHRFPFKHQFEPMRHRVVRMATQSK